MTGSRIVRKYRYPEIRREWDERLRGRVYVVDGEPLPSVTTILARTKDESGLDAWRRRVGEEEARRISREATEIGNAMHRVIEAWALGDDVPEPADDLSSLGHRMGRVIIERGLSGVDEVWGSEVNLFYPGMYAGTADMVGVWSGRPAIMDFKSTNKPKRDAWIGDYFCQLVAYARAHDVLFGTDIRCGVIFMCARDGTFQQFVIEGDRFAQWEREWAARLTVWYLMDGTVAPDDVPSDLRPKVDAIMRTIGRAAG